MTRHFIFSSPGGSDHIDGQSRTLIFAGLSIVAATYGLARYCFGLFLPDIRMEFSLRSETIGLIVGLSYAGYLVATFIGSWLSTTLNPRLPVLLGGVCAAAGMCLIALAPNPWVLGLGVFIAGTSPGLSYPPFSDIIVRHTAASKQNTVYAWINSGTGFGVALAGPLAIFAADSWRFAWLLFAILALAATVLNYFVLPNASTGAKRQALQASLKLLRFKPARPLFTAALVFGVITAVYWTYAVEMLVLLTNDSQAPVRFWIVLGLAGVTGCFAGGLVNTWGLRRTYLILLCLAGLSVGILPIAAGSMMGIYLSAAFFGASFIIMTALFGMWSIQIMRETPSIGFGATFFLISLGQGVGPVLGGFMIPIIGHTALFMLAGVCCCCLAVFKPPR